MVSMFIPSNRSLGFKSLLDRNFLINLQLKGFSSETPASTVPWINNEYWTQPTKTSKIRTLILIFRSLYLLSNLLFSRNGNAMVDVVSKTHDNTESRAYTSRFPGLQGSYFPLQNDGVCGSAKLPMGYIWNRG